MKKSFDYEKVFMGVTQDRSEGYVDNVYKEDYRLERLIQSIPATKGKMLDIGCGGGTLTECLPYFYPEMKVLGCDVSKTGISYAEKYGEGKVKYSVIKNNILPYRDNSIDIIVSLDVLEHVPDIHLFLKEIKRVLKKKGLLFFAVPCEGQPFTFTWFFQKIKIGHNLTFKHIGHIHPEFTHHYVTQLLETKEFRIVSKSYSEHFLYQSTTLFRFLLAKELLEFFFGKNKAEKYYDRSIISMETADNQKGDVMFLFRKVWLKFWSFVNVLTSVERKLLKNISFGGWKLFILSQNLK